MLLAAREAVLLAASTATLANTSAVVLLAASTAKAVVPIAANVLAARE